MTQTHITVRHASELLDLTTQTVLTYINDARIDAVKVGKKYMIPLSEIEYILTTGLRAKGALKRETQEETEAAS